MTPSCFSFYPANGALTNAIFSSNFLLLARVREYFSHLLFDKFCGCASFPTIRRSMLYAVNLVVLRSIPAKIGKKVVLWVSVIVATLLSRFWIATKCAKNNATNAAQLVFVFLPKKNGWPSVFLVDGRLLNPAGFYGTDSSKIRYLVKSFESWHWLPFFHDSIPITDDMGILP